MVLTLALTGCVSSRNKPVEVVDANRAAGVVTVGYVHRGFWPLSDNGEKARWDEAVSVAAAVCAKWGYRSAEVLTPHTQITGKQNDYGRLVDGAITRRYQCIGDQAN